MNALEVSDWNAANIAHVVTEELKRNGLSDLVSLVNALHDRLRKTISIDELFERVMRDVAIEMLKFSNPDE